MRVWLPESCNEVPGICPPWLEPMERVRPSLCVLPRPGGFFWFLRAGVSARRSYRRRGHTRRVTFFAHSFLYWRYIYTVLISTLYLQLYNRSQSAQNLT